MRTLFTRENIATLLKVFLFFVPRAFNCDEEREWQSTSSFSRSWVNNEPFIHQHSFVFIVYIVDGSLNSTFLACKRDVSHLDSVCNTVTTCLGKHLLLQYKALPHGHWEIVSFFTLIICFCFSYFLGICNRAISCKRPILSSTLRLSTLQLHLLDSVLLS